MEYRQGALATAVDVLQSDLTDKAGPRENHPSRPSRQGFDLLPISPGHQRCDWCLTPALRKFGPEERAKSSPANSDRGLRFRQEISCRHLRFQIYRGDPALRP